LPISFLRDLPCDHTLDGDRSNLFKHGLNGQKLINVKTALFGEWGLEGSYSLNKMRTELGIPI
jgi:hypothetical protein